MSISTEITRITTARNKIRTKLTSMGLADETHDITQLATDVDSIVDQGAVQATVVEGQTYTIPAGYHDGTGTVTALSDVVGDAEKYKLQQKEGIVPTKTSQTISPDQGFYGLSSVYIEAIPAAYQDVTSVNATAEDVLTGKTIVTKDGKVTAGTMADNGAVTRTLTAQGSRFEIPSGYHNGKGVVEVKPQTKNATPTKSEQIIQADTNMILGSVHVYPIPDEYIITNIDVDTAAASENILDGKEAYVNGELVEGSMKNNGTVSKTLDTTTVSFPIPAGYHSGSGEVSITLEPKTVTPTKAAQTIVPADGKVLSKVTVNAIPADYITTTDANATDENILQGKTAYVKGEKVTGTMPNNGAISGTINGTSATSYTVPAGYTTGGTVTLTNDIENALAAI